MKKLVLALASATALTAAPALAADLGRMPVKAPVAYAPAPFNWTGFYLGLNAGYGFGRNDLRVAPSADAASQAFWNPAFLAGAAPSRYRLEQDGFVGGGQIGYNVQTGMFVWGVEADLQGSGIRDSVDVATITPGFVPGFFSASQQLEWFGTGRARLGLTTGPALFYVTGGVAFGGVKYNHDFAFPASNDFHTVSRKDTEVGWTAGGGVEWAFGNNWSMKAEYLFIDLGDRSFTSTPGGRAANRATTLTTDFRNQYHIARLGLNYRFGGGPIMASY